jgi:hypothetical protein
LHLRLDGRAGIAVICPILGSPFPKTEDGNGRSPVSNDSPDRKLVYLNGDGKPDLIAANRQSPSYICLNDGRGNFNRRDCIVIPAESATTIVPTDFNRDGFIDLAVPYRDGGRSMIYFNGGKAGFTKTKPFGPATSAARAAAASDSLCK